MSAADLSGLDGGLLRFATAGSVDDGKSTLIGRLLHDARSIAEDQLAALVASSQRRGLAQVDLALLTDGLQAEREQGITIDVAYRYFESDGRRFIIADTPGHEQYTRNMVTAASTADLAVVLADVRKGALLQSRRHAFVSRLLGIDRLIVAVNKMDLADYRRDAFERVRAEFDAFVAPLGFAQVSYVPLSALHGDMVVERSGRLAWYTGPTLLEALRAAPGEADRAALPLRFPVQLVARAGVGGAGRGYMGRIEAGSVAVGDSVTLLPSGLGTTVAAILNHGGALARARAGQSVTLVLEDDVDLARGDLIAGERDLPNVTGRLEAVLCWFDEEPLGAGTTYLLRHGTRTVRAKVTDLAYRFDMATFALHPVERPAAMNDVVGACLALQQPLPVDPYSACRATGSFILVDPATQRTVAAGMVQ